MAKVKTKIYNDYCPQALFLYGTKQEDGQPHFGLFCWFGYCHLVSEQQLPLADYYGCICGRTTPDKMKFLPAVEWGQVLDTTVPFTERLMQAAPVLAPGGESYSSIDGRYLNGENL